MTLRDALATYTSTAGPATVRQTTAIVTRYVDAGGDGTDAGLTRYLAAMERDGYSRGTVDRHRRIIRSFYRTLQARPPVAIGWRYDSAAEGAQIALAPDTVHRLIAAAVDGTLSHRQAALLALATTYGLRAAKLAAVRPEDVRLADARLYCRTANGGVRRWQWVPPALIPYLCGA